MADNNYDFGTLPSYWEERNREWERQQRAKRKDDPHDLTPWDYAAAKRAQLMKTSYAQFYSPRVQQYYGGPEWRPPPNINTNIPQQQYQPNAPYTPSPYMPMSPSRVIGSPYYNGDAMDHLQSPDWHNYNRQYDQRSSAAYNNNNRPSSKSSWLTALALFACLCCCIVLLAGGGAAYYYYFKKDDTSSPTSSPTPAPTPVPISVSCTVDGLELSGKKFTMTEPPPDIGTVYSTFESSEGAKFELTPDTTKPGVSVMKGEFDAAVVDVAADEIGADTNFVNAGKYCVGPIEDPEDETELGEVGSIYVPADGKGSKYFMFNKADKKVVTYSAGTKRRRALEKIESSSYRQSFSCCLICTLLTVAIAICLQTAYMYYR